MSESQSSLKKPIFLVGCMRSGTTMLSKFLGAHPEIIHCPFELKDIWSKDGNVPMSSPKTRDTTCPCLDEKDIKPGQLEQLTNALNQRMKLVSHRKKKSNDGTLLNKNPHFCNKMPFVNGLFPDARFIWIYRDLPSVVASMKKLFNDNSHYWPKKVQNKTRCWIYHPDTNPPEGIDRSRFFPGGNVKYLAEYWYENNLAVSEFLAGIPQKRYLIIREEDLIADPRKIVKQCFQFLGVKEYIPESLINRVDSNRNSLWHERLTENELESLLDFVQDQGTKLDHIIPNQVLFRRYKNEIIDVL